MLARAFLRKADLIGLDEPTSAMDTWSEAAWMERFRELVDGHTDNCHPPFQHGDAGGCDSRQIGRAVGGIGYSPGADCTERAVCPVVEATDEGIASTLPLLKWPTARLGWSSG
jgi:hypothetical protein